MWPKSDHLPGHTVVIASKKDVGDRYDSSLAILSIPLEIFFSYLLKGHTKDVKISWERLVPLDTTPQQHHRGYQLESDSA
jgi:hypothetical protein